MENLEQLKEKFFNKTLSVEDRAKFVELMASDKAFAEDIAIELQLRKALIASNQLAFEVEHVEKKKVGTTTEKPFALTHKRTFLPYYYAAAITFIGICIFGVVKYKQYQEKQLLSEINKKAQELKNKEATAVSDSLKNAQALADSLKNKKRVGFEKTFTPSVQQEKITNNDSINKPPSTISKYNSIYTESEINNLKKQELDSFQEKKKYKLVTSGAKSYRDYIIAKDYKEAIKSGEAEFQKNSNNPELCYYMGVLYFLYEKNTPQALKYFDCANKDKTYKNASKKYYDLVKKENQEEFIDWKKELPLLGQQ